ncbi:SGNH/GDSL hydrolase family protein [Arthrobacter sp. USHLN218]|uniref:SGNH/GDSL hydrolase family protein n=1 Tax=Arthrobacter sp. USHLN218 TaxID=3081232 RepID=UPI0030189596
MPRERFYQKKVWQNIGVAVLALLTLGAIVYAFVPKPPPVAPGSAPAPSVRANQNAQQVSGTPKAAAAATVAAKEEKEPPVAVFLGDSYTEGIGASVPERRWSTLVAGELGWEEANRGVSGTGYHTSAGDAEYQGRVGQVLDDEPQIVVVSGGQNDFGTFAVDPGGTVQAIAGLYEALREELPQAEIVAVGPSTPGSVDQTVLAIDAAVREAAAAADATYVSLLEPDVLNPDMVIADQIHVDDRGHRAIADRVIAALE